MRRTVITTNSRSDVGEEYAEAVGALVEADRPPLRETTQKNKHGQTDYYVRVHAYAAPDGGGERWAVDYHDPRSRELEEFDTLAEAEAEYVEQVHASAENLGYDSEGLQERFTTCDVPGVPGPMPDLPEVTSDRIGDLIDSTDADAVLYVDWDDDGDIALHIGPAAEVPETGERVVTRAAVLPVAGLSDADGRATSEDVTEEGWWEVRFEIDQSWGLALRVAADRLCTEEEPAAETGA